MADIADFANDLAQAHVDRSIAAARQPIPAGAPGECVECEEHSPRLVHGRCAPCREPKRIRRY